MGGSGGTGPVKVETCEQAAAFPSSEGCEFWAVDLDQIDGAGNDPASAPWGVVVTATSGAVTRVRIEQNAAAPGAPQVLQVLSEIELQPGETRGIELQPRELDCGPKPNDPKAPGTCLSSQALRITADAPVTAQQFNTATNSSSNDASLLLPTSALGRRYHVIGWGAGHPVAVTIPGLDFISRSYVTIVGVEPGTEVTVTPTARIKGNGPVAKTEAGGTIKLTLGPFDVLNLETDAMTQQEVDALAGKKNPADLSGTVVSASKPVAVFSGSELTGVPGYLKVPTYPGWGSDTCCLDHLEEQMLPLETTGSRYVVTRSPVRSTGSAYEEPDVLRFVGGLEPSTVTTNLPPPFDQFTLQPGEVKDAWTQKDAVVSASKPISVGQLLVSSGYVQGSQTGDPSLLVLVPVEQFRTRYATPMPTSWPKNYAVLAVPQGAEVLLDGAPLQGCVVAPAGTMEGVAYEARRCQLTEGPHVLESAEPFGVSVYGYGSTGSYAYSGGASLAPINPLP
jgi:hypothetical protein